MFRAGAYLARRGVYRGVHAPTKQCYSIRYNSTAEKSEIDDSSVAAPSVSSAEKDAQAKVVERYTLSAEQIKARDYQPELEPWENPEDFGDTYLDNGPILLRKEYPVNPLERTLQEAALRKSAERVAAKEALESDDEEITTVTEDVAQAMESKRGRIVKSQPQQTAVLDPVDFERNLKSLMSSFRPADITKNNLEELVEQFKPRKDSITSEEEQQLIKDINKAFKSKQLREYAKIKGIRYAASWRKDKVIHTIIRQAWNVKQDDSEPVLKTRTEQQTVILPNGRSRFLFAAHMNYLQRWWGTFNAKVWLTPGKDAFVVEGSKLVNQFVQVSWTKLMNDVSSLTLKLKKLNHFYETELHRKMPISTLEKMGKTYFDQVGDNLYTLSSFNRSQLLFVKSALLAATEYSGTIQKEIDLAPIEKAEQDAPGISYQDYEDPSMPWYMRAEGPVYRAKVPSQRKAPEPLKLDDNIDQLLDDLLLLKQDIDQAEKNWQANFLEQVGEDADEATLNVPIIHNSADLKVTVDDLDLPNFKEKLLHPDVKQKDSWTAPVVNTAFGKALFQGKSTDSDVFFHSTFPDANAKLSQLPLFDKDGVKFFGSGKSVSNHFSQCLKLKLVPDAYKKFTNFKTLPNIEIWLDVSNGNVRVDRCDMFVNEHEYNEIVPLPQYTTDIKFQSSINSVLLSSLEDEESDMLRKQRPLYKVLHRIPDEFLKLSNVGQIRNVLQEHPIEIKLDDRYRTNADGTETKISKNVPYLVTDVLSCRSIDLDYNGMLVKYEVVGDANGERYEVTMQGDPDAEEQPSLEALAEKSLELAAFIE